MRAAIFFTLTLLTGVSVAPETKNPPVEIQNSRVWEHRIGPEEAIHRSQQEMEELKRQRLGFAQHTGQCLFEIIVSANGAVESFELLKGSQPCEPHQREAEAILRSRKYQPWLVDGVPARVKIQDGVNIYPPERWGASVPFPEKVDRSTLEFQLERTRCYGSCPAYTVSIAGDGTVRYDGQAFVSIPGRHTAQISPAAVTELIHQFRAANFLSALPRYQSNWTDLPTQALSLHINGQIKTVVDYFGLDVGLPLAIHNLETAIDKAAGSERWIKGNDETMASLQAEHWNFAAESAENLALYRKAIDANNAPLIEAFLRAQAPVATAIDKAAPMLCEASRTGNLQLVNDMLRNPQTLSAGLLNRCLADAAQSGNLPLVELWLEKGADPTAPIEIERKSDSDWIAGLGVLVGAVQSGNAEIVRKLLAYKVDVNARVVNGKPLLSWAIQRGRGDTAEIVRLLAQAGADVNAKDSLGQTPLFECALVPKAIKPLIDAGADIEARDQNGNTALINDAFNEAAVRELLANGADPAAATANGDTALKRAEHLACKPCADLIEAALMKKNGMPKN
jgi:hypothetical protein